MKDEGRIWLRTMIVEVLNESRNETSLKDLLTHLSDRGVKDETSVKAVIWQLIAEGDVELTSQRTLRIPGRYRSEFALAT
jgi:aconitase B